MLSKKTIRDIRDLNPCYDPNKYLPENWEGDALDILRVEDAPAQDKLWVVLRSSWIDDKTLRLFAVFCARDALGKVKNPDPRSIKALEVAEKFANGKASRDELKTADAADAAAAYAAEAAAGYAAYAAFAAAFAADAAAFAAAYADAAAGYAAYAAAYAADAAAYAAATAANAAAFAAAATADAARQRQVNKLIEMLEQ